ncbi:uncharacterized protein LOC143266626 [Megachile rotundata]|uniref:uncharacterized protein LOC143266626 n=1 Tax=Megachile rotundata TaxID=143995 RepID=UPI003FD2EE37
MAEAASSKMEVVEEQREMKEVVEEQREMKETNKATEEQPKNSSNDGPPTGTLKKITKEINLWRLCWARTRRPRPVAPRQARKFRRWPWRLPRRPWRHPRRRTLHTQSVQDFVIELCDMRDDMRNGMPSLESYVVVTD